MITNVRRFLSLFLIILAPYSLAFAQQTNNIIQNGDFSNDLDQWIFEDTSRLANCPAYPYGEAYVEDGRAVIHAHSCLSFGWLHQYLAPVTDPTYLSMEYEFIGSCSRQEIHLYNGEQRVLRYLVFRDSGLRETRLLFFENNKVFDVGYFVSPAKLEIYFDYTSMKGTLYLNGTVHADFSIPSSLSVDRVSLMASNGCYDGRNDVYGKFDNVVLSYLEEEPVAVAEPGLDANGNLILDGSKSYDPDGTIISWEWAFENRDPSGNNFMLNGVTVSAEVVDVGVYNVTLTVTDDDDLKGTDGLMLAVPSCIARPQATVDMLVHEAKIGLKDGKMELKGYLDLGGYDFVPNPQARILFELQTGGTSEGPEFEIIGEDQFQFISDAEKLLFKLP